jgi:hypothetical protein
MFRNDLMDFETFTICTNMNVGNNLMDFETFTICSNMSAAGSPKATKGIDRSSTLFDLKLVCLEWR